LADAPTALAAEADRASLMDDFFSAGDEGRYEGGPATLAPPDEIELDEAAVAVVRRTPAMDARRARFTRWVAAAVGCLAAVSTIGALKSRAFAQGSEPERASVAAPVRAAANAAAKPAVEAQRAFEAKPVLDAKPAVPAVEATSVLAPKAAPAHPPPAPARPAAAPAKTAVSFAAPPAPAPRIAPEPPARALPSVANFAAKAGEPVRSAGNPPTASFAVVK
jgi:hypothetical protein